MLGVEWQRGCRMKWSFWLVLIGLISGFIGGMHPNNGEESYAGESLSDPDYQIFLPGVLLNSTPLDRLGRIAFVNNRGWVSVMKADGSEVRELNDPVGGNHGSSCKNDLISWSPDGKNLVYATDTSLFILPFDGSPGYTIADSTNRKCAATWSPDGLWIAFGREDAEGVNEIYIVQPDGSDLTRITDGDGFCYNPVWSPDGEKIAFACQTTSGDNIYVMSKTGSDQIRLTENGESFYPSWSPDGTQVAFEVGCFNCWAQIYIINRDGSDLRQLTSVYGDNRRPTWSPNQKWIAFESRNSNQDIYRVDPASLAVQQLTETTDWERRPSWSPDSQYLAFTKGSGIAILEIQTGSLQIVATSGSKPSWSTNAFP